MRRNRSKVEFGAQGDDVEESQYQHERALSKTFVDDCSLTNDIDSVLGDFDIDRCARIDYDSEDEDVGDDRLLSDAFMKSEKGCETKNLELDDHDVHRYMNKREMSPLQERCNALTILPGALYCIYFVLNGNWITAKGAADSIVVADYFDQGSCLNISFLPNLSAIPPAPILLNMFGVLAHCPFSFLYHWKYAIELQAGAPRICHWSRRMDHFFIHVSSALTAFSTSGSWTYFLLCTIFNSVSAVRHFDEKIVPRRNQIRLTIALALFALPLLTRGEMELFLQLTIILALSGWFFITYPVGGWSHSVFHIVVAFVPVLTMKSASELDISQPQIEIALQCLT